MKVNKNCKTYTQYMRLSFNFIIQKMYEMYKTIEFKDFMANTHSKPNS